MKGYTTLTFEALTGGTSTSTAAVVYHYNTSTESLVEKVGSSSNMFKYTADAVTAWIKYEISLSQIAENCTVIFDGSGKDVWITNVFFGPKQVDTTKIDYTGDFSTYQDVWNSYDGTITYGHEITRDGVTKTVLQFYTATNLGKNMNDNKAGDYYHLSNISLDASIIAGAIQAGYTAITFTLASGNTPVVESASVANRVSIHDYKGTGTVNGASGYIYRTSGADAKWVSYTVELSALTKGTISFASGGDTLYVAEVYFTK